jgi:rare lipoprotein A
MVSGRKAATLYVRNIPVLTFVGATPTPPTDAIKVGIQTQKVPQSKVPAAGAAAAAQSVASRSPVSDVSPALLTKSNGTMAIAKPNASLDLSSEDPVWKATQVAAQLNQLNRDGFDAKTIGVKAAPAQGNQPAGYQIKVGDKVLTTVNEATFLAGSTQDPSEDALQAANRLRRLMGGAEALSGVEGRYIQTQIGMDAGLPNLLNVVSTLSGYASWYGPGFNGNVSASGEVFNQHAMTAAHRHLPFGTRVRVTNVNNGRSVVVRINDRGPYAGDRILDLSMGAADQIGLISAGVGMIRMDVLGKDVPTIGSR